MDRSDLGLYIVYRPSAGRTPADAPEVQEGSMAPTTAPAQSTRSATSKKPIEVTLADFRRDPQAVVRRAYGKVVIVRDGKRLVMSMITPTKHPEE